MKVSDLKVTKTTTREVKNALGKRVRTREPIEIKRKVKTVTPGKRFVHYLIDGIILGLITFGLGYLGYQSGYTAIVSKNGFHVSTSSLFNFGGHNHFICLLLFLGSNYGKNTWKNGNGKLRHQRICGKPSWVMQQPDQEFE